MNVRKTIRILAVSLAILALLVFSTTVVSDWDCRTAADDVRCPYCHLSHQAPAPEFPLARIIATLEPVGFLPLPEEVILVTGPVLSEIAARAPPSA